MEAQEGQRHRAAALFQQGEAACKPGRGVTRRQRSSLLCCWATFTVAGVTHSAKGALERVDRARALFEEAVDLCPTNAPAWVQWADMEGAVR